MEPWWAALATRLGDDPRSFALHRSAAALHRFDAFGPGEVGFSPLPATGIAYPSRPRVEGCRRISNVAPGDLGQVAGLRTTAPLRTLVDLGSTCDEDLVERAVECALRRKLVSERALRDPATTFHKRGGPVLCEVMARRPVGAAPTESDAETLVVQLIRRGGLRAPVRQLWVLLDRRYRLDLAWPDLKVVVEVDGRIAHGWDRRSADLRRQNQLVRAGWRVLRFTWEDITRYPDQVCEAIRAVIGG